jgi:hypothetical protein
MKTPPEKNLEVERIVEETVRKILAYIDNKAEVADVIRDVLTTYAKTIREGERTKLDRTLSHACDVGTAKRIRHVMNNLDRIPKDSTEVSNK